MDKVWNIAMKVGAIFGFVCLFILFGYSAGKSVVITEQQDLKGAGDLSPLTERIKKEKYKYDFVVIVNPAHGGANRGNEVNGRKEKDITLAVGEYLEKMSKEGEVGIFTLRKGDIDISNESRAQLVEEVEPDLVIDLHVNADPGNERTFGTSVVYNAKFYMATLTNARLADILEKNLVTEIQGKALGVHQDEGEKYPFLNMMQVPTAGVELGYLTNKQEAALLGTESYQKRIAKGLYKGILAAREEMKSL